MENLSLPLAQGDLFFLFAHSGNVAGLQRVSLFNAGVGFVPCEAAPVARI